MRPKVMTPVAGVPEHAVRALLQIVEAEYAEMPGLSLTLAQAQRLWTADPATCAEVYARLTMSGVLRKTIRGRFVRA